MENVFLNQEELSELEVLQVCGGGHSVNTAGGIY